MNGGVYKRRTPEKSDLYEIAYQHFEEYEKIYPERYEEEYGYFRKIITATICKYLDCGIMENGLPASAARIDAARGKRKKLGLEVPKLRNPAESDHLFRFNSSTCSGEFVH